MRGLPSPWLSVSCAAATWICRSGQGWYVCVGAAQLPPGYAGQGGGCAAASWMCRPGEVWGGKC